MEWFKKAADQGHPHSSYNLAIGHLKGLPSPINQTYYFKR
jgi:TPR repeat protein